MRTYGRFFAEFLNEDSLVLLRLLASPTCVGLRYDLYIAILRGFSRKTLRLNFQPKLNFFDFRISPLKAVQRIFLSNNSRNKQRQTIKTLNLIFFVTPSNYTEGLEY